MQSIDVKDYKGVDNAWISPEGDLYKCGYMGHSEWGYEYFMEKNNNDFIKANAEIEKIHNGSLSAYPHTALEKLGWVRILTWSNSITGVYGEGKKPNKEQQDTIMFWCSMNNRDFETFINKYNA